jgi:hypothetical protein
MSNENFKETNPAAVTMIHTAEREAEIQRRQLQFPEIVACGNKQIDELASLVFEARRSLVLGEPVVSLSSLNVAMDIISELQNEYRAME